VARLQVRPLRADEREAALAHLDRAPRLNLVLADLALRLGAPSRAGEGRAELLAALRGGQIAGLAGLHPSVVLDATAERETLEAFFPYVGSVGTGLVKSTEDVVAPLWEWLAARGRRALLDRIEHAFAVTPETAKLAPERSDVVVRAATPADLEALVVAARESLLEEHRPDPVDGDYAGFRRWVRSRIPRAVVVESEGGVSFVGYADVQCSRGALVQGVYTWRDERRRGLAALGVSALCRRAFAAGSEHVQLAVVEGNEPAVALYRGLGFEPFARLRTLLFT
jgi:RimJ/RimL family protein N-acetyltransferase